MKGRVDWRNGRGGFRTLGGPGRWSAMAMLGLLAVGGCSATPPPRETPAQKAAVMKFDLSKCEQLQPGLFRCPESDKPLCAPTFMRSDVDCVRVGKSGEVMTQP